MSTSEAMDEKRAMKEAFVSNLTGTNSVEVIAIASLPAVLLLITQILAVSRSPRMLWAVMWVEFGVLICPLVIQLMMDPSDFRLWPVVVFGSMSLISLILVASRWRVLKRQWSTLQMLTMRQALSTHRGGVMILTCISILAVDFHAFPRRFAKTETYGTGLMDAGVGSVIVASAFATGLRAANAYKSSVRINASYRGSLKRNIGRLAILLGLGIARPLVTSLSGYQHHVGEYGMHWNFFVTLAAVRFLSLIVPEVVTASPILGGIAGTLVLVPHQWRLSHGLVEYVHSNERMNDFFSLNKEGLHSLPGYFALHLLGCACGAFIEVTSGPRSVKSKQRLRIMGLVIFLWSLYAAFSAWVQPVSRRACNMTYVLWVLSLNLQSLILMGAVLAATPSLPLPNILVAINDTMLPTFLMANMLTGAINLLFDTMQMGNVIANLVVLLYMAIVCAFAVFLSRWFAVGHGPSSSIKLWKKRF